MLTFNPQSVEVKEQGRIELANAAGLSLKDAAPFFTRATHKNFQNRFNRFVDAFPAQARHISANRLDGVGPGEMVAWFVFDNVTLGGKNAALDINVNGAPFAELKGGHFTKKNGTLDDFKITKDGDPAVGRLLTDLDVFNHTYRQLKGQDLTGWKPGSIGRLALDLWNSIDLIDLAQQLKGVPRERVYIPVDPNGDVWDISEKKRVSHLAAEDLAVKVVQIAQAERKISVDNKTSTLRKIISRWVDQVFVDYLDNKHVALINNDTMRMLFFGQLTKDMVGLYRIHRNQPWARIYLETGETE